MDEDLITKLMLGKDDITKVTIDDNIINLRPLTAGELAKLKRIEQQDIKFNTQIGIDGENVPLNTANVDTGLFLENQNHAKFQAIAWSMSCNGLTVTVDAVEKFRKEIPDLLFKEIIKISKLTEKDLTSVKNFQ